MGLHCLCLQRETCSFASYPSEPAGARGKDERHVEQSRFGRFLPADSQMQEL